MNVRTKILVAIILLVSGMSMASAQKVESKSRSFTVEKTKTHHPLNWLIKAGLGVKVSHSDDLTESRFNYDIAVGFKRQFTSHYDGFYWGALLGFTERDELVGYGYSYDYHREFESKGSLYLGPMLGYNKPISDILTFDTHLLAAFHYSFHDEDCEHGHVLGEIGIGMWIKRFLVEIDYQLSSNSEGIRQSFLLNLGYRF